MEQKATCKRFNPNLTMGDFPAIRSNTQAEQDFKKRGRKCQELKRKIEA